MKTDIHFFIIFRLFLIRMRNVSDRSCTENQITHFVFSNTFSENRAVYEIMWKNIVEWGRVQMAIWRMRTACCIAKATNTHSHNMQYLLLYHHNKGSVNAPQCYVTSTLSLLFILLRF
jgi:hypothetical protein